MSAHLPTLCVSMTQNAYGPAKKACENDNIVECYKNWSCHASLHAPTFHARLKLEESPKQTQTAIETINHPQRSVARRDQTTRRVELPDARPRNAASAHHAASATV
jgi:hypothetical protein